MHLQVSLNLVPTARYRSSGNNNPPSLIISHYSFLIMASKYNDNNNIMEEREVSFPPAHTAEHLLNQTMIRLFGCERSYNAHVERKKSKMSFHLSRKPTRQEEKEIERRMNELIEADLPVTFEYVRRDSLPEGIDAGRLPDDAGDDIRLVRIDDYDVCPCIGKHVRSTGQIGRFEMLGTNWDEMERSFRVRFKIISAY